MLKWLRKYNTFILVVGGCLLMVAFLLGSVLQDLGRRGLFGGTAFKIGSKRVSQEEFGRASIEHAALSRFLPLSERGGGDNAEHWYLLTREADLAGFVGGKKDGEEYLDDIALGMAQEQVYRIGLPQSNVESFRSMIRSRLEDGMKRAAAEAHLSQDDLFKAFAKLRGAVRLQNAYYGAARFSARRLTTDSRAVEDAVAADYVLVPAERELAGVPEPTKAEIAAHFDKYKNTPRTGGEFGIGYKLPPRVKIEWMEINRNAISDAIAIDSIEVEKRFLAKYPDGKTPEGKTPDLERAAIEKEVRKEVADKALAEADQLVRFEIEKTLHKLDRENDYFKLPADWNTLRPDFQKIRELIARRLKDQYNILIAAPKVAVRANTWTEQNDVTTTLEGFGGASLRRPQGSRSAASLIFSVRELGEGNEFDFQVGIPFPEALENAAGNKYFFTVLDARKESPADTLEEVEAQVARNIKRLHAYEKLRAAEPALLAIATSVGLEAVAKAPEGSSAGAIPIQEFSVRKGATVARADAIALDTQAFRDTVIRQTSGLDPLTDLAKVLPAAKTFSIPVDNSLSVCIYRVKKFLPLTLERFRAMQGYLLREVSQNELNDNPDNSPFTFEAMKARLNVTDSEGRTLKSDKKTQP
jgi:hypothetical protein